VFGFAPLLLSSIHKSHKKSTWKSGVSPKTIRKKYPSPFVSCQLKKGQNNRSNKKENI
jgi:hypothetical protein